MKTTVKEIRAILEGLPGDLPVSFYPITDAWLGLSNPLRFDEINFYTEDDGDFVLPSEPGAYAQVYLKEDTTRKPELTVEQAALKAAKDDAFDFSRATNLYLLTARELGTCLGGRSVTDLLDARTGWSVEKCKIMGDRVVNDQSIIDLLTEEGVPAAYE